MPAMHAIKDNKRNAFYHIYNRGTDKKLIFKDKNDYTYFVNIMKRYLNPTELRIDKITGQQIVCNNMRYIGNKIELYAYCLMPNHIHLLVKQIEKHTMSEFVRKVVISYAMYFNGKYDASGRLFQGVYKARTIRDNTDLTNTIEYIHSNPINLIGTKHYEWSSYKYYRKVNTKIDTKHVTTISKKMRPLFMTMISNTER